MNENTILHTVPAAGELHKVSGFDPMKHLYKSVNAQGEPVMRLEPRYQRLWFRLACPKGRMLLNPLRVTDQLAIFEAKVFFHRDDTTPASSFTANKTARETPDYIRAAQDEALKEALDNAGFGIQLCDVTQGSHRDETDEAAMPVQVGNNEPARIGPTPISAPVEPVPEKEAPPTVPTVENTETVRPEVIAAPPVETSQKEEMSTARVPVSEPVPAVQHTEKEADLVQAQDKQGTPQCDDAAPADHLAAVLNFPVQTAEVTPTQEAATVETAETAAPGGADDPPAPTYTEDMPVEEICKVMTLEQARSVVVTKGTCKGWTMGQVVEKRPSSLRFYLSGFGSCSKIQLAAATLLMQDMEMKKAS